MHNVEQAPAEIFEWLETSDLSELSEKNRTTVLSYFTGEEYNEMRTAVKMLNNSAAAERVHLKHKVNVLTRFDDFHGKVKRGQAVPFIWKIAAGLLPLMLMAVTYWFAKGQDQEKQTLVVHDTVYSSQVINGPVVYDTVFIEKPVNGGTKMNTQKVNEISASQVLMHTVKEVDILPLTDQEKVENSIRNYSVRDDSLFDLFPSIAM